MTSVVSTAGLVSSGDVTLNTGTTAHALNLSSGGAAKGVLGYNAASNSYLSGSIGDVVLSNTNTSKNVLIGVGAGTNAATMSVGSAGATCTGNLTVTGGLTCSGTSSTTSTATVGSLFSNGDVVSKSGASVPHALVLQDGSGNTKGNFGYNVAATSYLNGSIGDVCLLNSDTTKAVRIGVGTTPYLTVSTSGATVAGIFSCSTNSATMGPLSCASITTNSGNASMGAVICSSLNDTGPFTCGTNAATTGALTSTSVTSTGPLGCGTNPALMGAVTCSSINSSGAATTGALTSTSITSTGTATVQTLVSNTDVVSKSSASVAHGLVLQDSSANTKGNFGYNVAATSYLNGSIGDVCLLNTDTTKAVRIGLGTIPYLSVSTSGSTVSGTFTCGTNAATTGALSCSSITTNSGTASTGALTCAGTLTCWYQLGHYWCFELFVHNQHWHHHFLSRRSEQIR